MKTLFVFTSIILLIGCSERTVRGGYTTTPRIGYIDKREVNVIFLDSRIIKKNTIAIEKSIVQFIQKTYPLAWVRYRLPSEYFCSPDRKAITIKIKLNDISVERNLSTNYNHTTSINNLHFNSNQYEDTDYNLIQNMDVYITNPKFKEDFYTNINSVNTLINRQQSDEEINTLKQNTLEELTTFIDYTIGK